MRSPTPPHASPPNHRVRLLTQLLLCLHLTPAHAAPPQADATKAQIIPHKQPTHIAIIMDGNGRWATRQGKPRTYGHQNALQSIREAIEGCTELSIPHLTLYAFSIDNWQRPPAEVNTLIHLITTTIRTELEELAQNNIRITFIGDLQRLPQSCQQALQHATQATQHNQGLHLTIALSYSGRWDLTQAAQTLAQAAQKGHLNPQDITTDLLQQHLTTKNLPDPDLLIRTGGEQRLSDFCLLPLAYTELHFTPTLWPDFRKTHLHQAIIAYQKRQRKFGKLSTTTP